MASYACVAPLEVASADRARRLFRGSDRQLNSAAHLVALTQIEGPKAAGGVYDNTKVAAGKTHNEAVSCLSG